MMPETTQKLMKNAVCAQIEYLDANGGREWIWKWNVRATLGSFLFETSSGTGSLGTVYISPRRRECSGRLGADLSRRDVLSETNFEKTVDSHSTLYQRGQCG